MPPQQSTVQQLVPGLTGTEAAELASLMKRGGCAGAAEAGCSMATRHDICPLLAAAAAASTGADAGAMRHCDEDCGDNAPKVGLPARRAGRVPREPMICWPSHICSAANNAAESCAAVAITALSPSARVAGEVARDCSCINGDCLPGLGDGARDAGRVAKSVESEGDRASTGDAVSAMLGSNSGHGGQAVVGMSVRGGSACDAASKKELLRHEAP